MSCQCRCKCHPIFSDCQKHSKQKTQYEKNLIVHLKPENASAPIRQELNCNICKGCVWVPQRCDNCGAYHCKQCLDPFVKQFGTCPTCSEPFEPRAIQKSVTESLEKLKFTCTDCDTQFDYKDALDHMKFCIKYLLETVQIKIGQREARKKKIKALEEGDYTCLLPNDCPIEGTDAHLHTS